jgi:hypothetical protein
MHRCAGLAALLLSIGVTLSAQAQGNSPFTAIRRSDLTFTPVDTSMALQATGHPFSVVTQQQPSMLGSLVATAGHVITWPGRVVSAIVTPLPPRREMPAQRRPLR